MTNRRGFLGKLLGTAIATATISLPIPKIDKKPKVIVRKGPHLNENIEEGYKKERIYGPDCHYVVSSYSPMVQFKSARDSLDKFNKNMKKFEEFYESHRKNNTIFLDDIIIIDSRQFINHVT